MEEQNIDLGVMDYELPEMDGFESAKAIRQAEWENGRQRLSIVALTAHAMNKGRQKTPDFGMDDFLSKPFGFEELRDVICKYLTPRVSQNSVHTALNA